MYDFELKPVITSKGFQASNLLIQRKVMNSDIAGEQRNTACLPSDATVAPPEPFNVASIHSRIVEVPKQKKKIQVIEINDSEEKQQKPSKTTKVKERKVFTQPSKPKKMIIRCMLCKEPGKKATMKACLDCKLYSHLSCLEMEGEQILRYLCRKCKHKREQNLHIRKGEKGGDQKITMRRLEKEKKKEEQQKKMGQFQELYPYYFLEDKIRFPIDDKLLFIYRELFDFSQTPKQKPIPHPLIPPHLLADFIQIQNFFSTFREELTGFGTLPSEIKKDIFYLSMGSNGYDGVFCSLLQNLLNIYLSDIFDKNKTDNVRILNDHPFFTLLTHLSDNLELDQQVLIKAAKEIIRYLATIPSMKKAFQEFEFPQIIDLANKTKILVALIQGLSEIDEFHDLVSIKSEKMQQLTKQKTQLIAQLKIDEAENLSNNEKLKDMNMMSRELEQSQEGVTRLVTKQLDKHKKKIHKLASQKTKSQETIREIRNKIAEIAKVMPFITSSVYYLGKDRNDSEYFFYMREPNRIYIKYRAYLMDENQNFFIYQTKESIVDLMRSLNTKGIKQRHLYENIQSLIKDEVITNNITSQQASGLMLEEQKFRDITLYDVLTMIKETEQTFTTYLFVKEYQWASSSVREMFMEQFMNITDLQILKENLRSLQQNFLFAQSMNNGETFLRREYQSDEDVKIEAKEGRKKIPIRIWGINSEKTKKYWLQYLQECIDVLGIWICAYIFKNNVDKYVKKKMEAYEEMKMKEKRLTKKTNLQRGRPPLRKIQQSQKNQKSVSEKIEISQYSSQVIESRRPNLRRRKQKKMNIDSQMSNEPADEQPEQSSSNEDCCEVCGEYGEMICCDTCPKVYHVQCLKMKDVPEGEWSCVKCLEKLSNERQTRSRVKKMGKFG